MHQAYEDIIGRVGDPKWWDEHGVPRYSDFHPSDVDIYAKEVVLFEVACQNCDHRFVVTRVWTSAHTLYRLSSLIPNELEYGDPPNIGCCPCGFTMNSVPIRVLEFWKRDRLDWERVPALEVALECVWMKDEQ